MDDDQSGIAALTQAIQRVSVSLDSIAAVHLAAKLYPDVQASQLVQQYRSLREDFRIAKQESQGLGNERLDQLIERLGEDEGNREFERQREIFRKAENAWDTYRKFHDEHPAIGILFSCEIALAKRITITS